MLRILDQFRVCNQGRSTLSGVTLLRYRPWDSSQQTRIEKNKMQKHGERYLLISKLIILNKGTVWSKKKQIKGKAKIVCFSREDLQLWTSDRSERLFCSSNHDLIIWTMHLWSSFDLYNLIAPEKKTLAKATNLSLFQMENMLAGAWHESTSCSLQIVLFCSEYMISLGCIINEGAPFQDGHYSDTVLVDSSQQTR